MATKVKSREMSCSEMRREAPRTAAWLASPAARGDTFAIVRAFLDGCWDFAFGERGEVAAKIGDVVRASSGSTCYPKKQNDPLETTAPAVAQYETMAVYVVLVFLGMLVPKNMFIFCYV